MFSKIDLLEAVAATGGTLRCHASENAKFYNDAWQAFDAWLYDVFTEGKTARTPRFATLGWEIMGTGTIGGGAHKPFFVLDIDVDPLAPVADRARVTTAIQAFDPLKIAMKFSRLLTKDSLAAAVADILKAFRHTCRSGRDMSIEFQVGRFLSRGGSAQFYFDSGLCARVSKSIGFALQNTGSNRPPSSFPSTAKRIMTAGVDTQTLPGGLAVSPITRDTPSIPDLKLSLSRTTSAGSGLRLSTRRLEKDPLKAKKLVADAAYQRFLETVKKQQELEVKSQQQYDMDVISFDRDLVNSVYTRAEKKIELKTSLDAQVADERRRKQQELEEALAPPDLTSGSILPTMDLRKFSKHAEADLPAHMDVSRFPEVDAHVFKAQYFEALEHAEQQRQLKEGLDRQVKLKAEMERRRKDEERATERRIAREVAEREAEDFQRKLELRHASGMDLKTSWDRDKELREIVAHKQKEMLSRATRWREDMARTMAQTYRQSGRIDLDLASSR